MLMLGLLYMICWEGVYYEPIDFDGKEIVLESRTFELNDPQVAAAISAEALPPKPLNMATI